MKHWTVDAPTTLDFDGVAALRVRVVSGTVAVLSTDDQPRLKDMFPTAVGTASWAAKV